MSKEKAEALRQIDEIKSHLVDKQTFYPYNYHATYMWSIVSLLLTFFTVTMYEMSITIGTVFTFVLITIGFVTEGVMTKKVNESYDIEDCTRRQQFIMMSFMMIAFFMLIMTAIFASYALYVPIFLMWLFMISLGYYSVGFVLNIERFIHMAFFNMISSMILLLIGFLNETLEGANNEYLFTVQVFMVIGLAIMPAIVAWQQIKDGK